MVSADRVNHRIRKITPGGVVSTFAGSGKAGGNDGRGYGAQFDGPAVLVIDKAGNLYVVETGSHRVRKITPVGIVSTLAGSGGDKVGSFDFQSHLGVLTGGGR